MAFQTITDLYIMEGTSEYLALQLVFVDVPAEGDRQVQIDSSHPEIAYVNGGGVILPGLSQSADVPLIIEFDDLSSDIADTIVVLTLTLGLDSVQINLH